MDDERIPPEEAQAAEDEFNKEFGLNDLIVEDAEVGDLSDAAYAESNSAPATDTNGHTPEFGVPNHRATKKPLLTALRGGKTATPKKAKTKASIPRRQGMFIKPLTNLYTSIGIGIMAVDQQCGEVIIKSAEQCAQSLDDLAYQNESVRRVLYGLIQTSAAGAVVIAHAPILISVMLHHMPGMSSRLGNLNLQSFNSDVGTDDINDA